MLSKEISHYNFIFEKNHFIFLYFVIYYNLKTQLQN